jgi:hypothetical protein
VDVEGREMLPEGVMSVAVERARGLRKSWVRYLMLGSCIVDRWMKCKYTSSVRYDNSAVLLERILE